MEDKFSSYFESAYTADNGNTVSFLTPNNGSERLGSLRVTEPGVLALLLDLHTHQKRNGPGEIPNMFLKRYAERIIEILVLVFNVSLSCSSLPTEWKMAKVVPIRQSGVYSLASGYTPISLECTCFKLLKHIILKFVTVFIGKDNILCSEQHGFRSGLSAVTQLVHPSHDFETGINNRSQIDVLFLDPSKAFDRVSEMKLFKIVHKFKKKGEGPIVSWIGIT